MAHVQNKQKRKRKVQKSNNANKQKKRNTPSLAATPNTTSPRSTECRYPLNTMLEPGQRSSKCAYITKRVADRCGLTIQQALQLSFTNARGQVVKYRKADLYYDIRTKTLALTDAHTHTRQEQRTHDDEPIDTGEVTTETTVVLRQTPDAARTNVATAIATTIFGPPDKHAIMVTATAIPLRRPTSTQQERRIQNATEEHAHNSNMKRKSRDAAIDKRQEKTRRTTYNTTLTNRETISIPDNEREDTPNTTPKQLEWADV
jgi:hypothetical protein